MFYDLNIPWSASDAQLPRTLAFLHELGYNVVALNHSLSGKLPNDLTNPIPTPLPFKDLPPNLTVLRRCTLTLTETYQNARLAELSRNYDLLALRPVDERTLGLACTSLDCDIITLDLTQRLPFWFKHKMINEAVKSGKRFELSYAQGIATADSSVRRNLISNATQLIRASRGRGLVMSSGAAKAVACRAPWDVVNLAAVWGLGQERGYEAVSKECRSVVVAAKFKRTSYRGVIDVVYGGMKPTVQVEAKTGEEAAGKLKDAGRQQPGPPKRKASQVEGEKDDDTGQPVSKREMKRRKKAMMLAANGPDEANGGDVKEGES